MKKTVCVVVSAAFTLIACSGKTDANEKNFSRAVGQYLEIKGELCLRSHEWPVEVQVGATTPGFGEAQMLALERIGLVKGVFVEKPLPYGMKSRANLYSLTAEAKPFVREKENFDIEMNMRKKIIETRLCWGKKRLSKLVKWEGPMKLGDYQEARVIYTYKIDDIAPWARDATVQAAFAEVQTELAGVSNRQVRHTVKLTSQGWEALGLDQP